MRLPGVIKQHNPLIIHFFLLQQLLRQRNILNKTIKNIGNNEYILIGFIWDNVVWVHDLCCEHAERDCGLLVYDHGVEDELGTGYDLRVVG